MSVQHANRGVIKKDLQLYYNREFVKSFRGEATTNTCNLNSRYNYVWANAVVTRDTVAPSPPPITGFEIAKLRSTDGLDAQTILYTASVDQVNGGTYTHSAYIYLESGTYVKVGQHWNPWDYGVPNYIPKNKWTRVSYTVANTPNNYGDVACAYNTDGTIYITATQYEKKSYSTPFVNGSRSANTIAGGGGLLDISGNNINADLTNVSFNSSGYYFNGSSNSIYLGTELNLQNGTVCAWVNSSITSATTYHGIIGKTNGGTTGQQTWYIDWISGNTLRGGIGDSSGAEAVTYTWNPAAGTWYFISFVFDSSYLYLYINGVLVAGPMARTRICQNSAHPVYIGRVFEQAAYAWNGQIGQVSINRRELTASEILQNFNATRKTYGV
jgi:hypothetical protein